MTPASDKGKFFPGINILPRDSPVEFTRCADGARYLKPAKRTFDGIKPERFGNE